MKIITALCLIPSLIWGVIYESDRMQDILSHVHFGTMVVIDIDNTLIESSMHLGSAQWRTYIRNKAASLGYDAAASELILDKFWMFAQHFVPVRLVDPAILSVIDQLKLEHPGIIIVALSAREPSEMEHTRRQLDSVGVVLLNGSFRQHFALPAPHHSIYHKGVIYCGDNKKSEALFAFFQALKYYPKRVIFVDDKLSQVQEVEKFLEQKNIEFIGIRFSAADQRVKAFDPEIAELQFSQLPKIISDEEAKRMLP
jgi:hypothetical protein